MARVLEEEFWVFAYGSLMWRPGFEYEERQGALLHGVHRALCVYSYVHRGTPQKPGLVLGLDRGGACRGIAFRVAAEKWPDTLRYLREREQVTMVYREARQPIVLLGNVPRKTTALVYVVDRSHPQYAGKLSLARQLIHVRDARGGSGPNPDYIINTAAHLRELGLRDHALDWLAEKLLSIEVIR